MGVTAEDKLYRKLRVLFHPVVAVAEQDDIVVGKLRPQPPDKFFRRLEIRPAVGILNAGKHDALAAALQHHILVSEIFYAAGFQNVTELVDLARRKIVVAADKIHIADIRKPLRQLTHRRQIAAVCDEIAGKGDDIRLFGFNERDYIVNKFSTVEIRQLHYLKAGKALRQSGVLRSIMRKLQIFGAVPYEKNARKANQRNDHKDSRSRFLPSFFHLPPSVRLEL